MFVLLSWDITSSKWEMRRNSFEASRTREISTCEEVSAAFLTLVRSLDSFIWSAWIAFRSDYLIDECRFGWPMTSFLPVSTDESWRHVDVVITIPLTRKRTRQTSVYKLSSSHDLNTFLSFLHLSLCRARALFHSFFSPGFVARYTHRERYSCNIHSAATWSHRVLVVSYANTRARDSI